MSGTLPTTKPAQAERPFPFAARWLTTGTLLAAMVLLQLGWLGVIWLTGATAATHKLLPLTVATLLLGTAVYLLPDRFFTMAAAR